MSLQAGSDDGADVTSSARAPRSALVRPAGYNSPRPANGARLSSRDLDPDALSDPSSGEDGAEHARARLPPSQRTRRSRRASGPQAAATYPNLHADADRSLADVAAAAVARAGVGGSDAEGASLLPPDSPGSGSSPGRVRRASHWEERRERLLRSKAENDGSLAARLRSRLRRRRRRVVWGLAGVVLVTVLLGLLVMLSGGPVGKPAPADVCHGAEDAEANWRARPRHVSRFSDPAAVDARRQALLGTGAHPPRLRKAGAAGDGAPVPGGYTAYTVRCDEEPASGQPFCDASLSRPERVGELIGLLQLGEKVQLLSTTSPGVPRLGLPPYEWWNEALHGVKSYCMPGGGACPTVFPAPVNLASTFNPDLIHRVAAAIGDEARALYEAGAHNFDSPPRGPLGLDFFSPVINVMRDPRWGRSQETAGEDPTLIEAYLQSYVAGFRGKAADKHGRWRFALTLKHFAAYSLEKYGAVDRFNFNAVVSERDLRQTYLPAFHAGVVSDGVAGVMCSYNEVNGVPSCADEDLLGKTLRFDWGFGGLVVSDCDAVDTIFSGHHFAPGDERAAADALKAGTDLDCGLTFAKNLGNAVESGLVSVGDVDVALERVLTARFRLGLFDPPGEQPLACSRPGAVGGAGSTGAAYQSAVESVVLLRNDPGADGGGRVLPLSPGLRVAVIGPHGNATEAMLSNYHGVVGGPVESPLVALRRSLGAANVTFAPGCQNVTSTSRAGFAAAAAAAAAADVAVVFVGNDQAVASEGRDRVSIALPGVQEELLAAVGAVQNRTVVVVLSGAAVSLPWAHASAPAVVWAGYPGELGGRAIADVLVGAYSPSGRLPFTMYGPSYEQQSNFTSMDMRQGPGRTYRFYTGEPFWPFGAGLSYSTFDINLRALAPLKATAADEDMTASVTLKNSGSFDADRTVLAVLVPPPGHDDSCPLRQLVDFGRVSLAPGESINVEFGFTPLSLGCVDADGRTFAPPGRYKLLLDEVAGVFDLA